MKNTHILLITILLTVNYLNAAPLSDELVVLHSATTAEMNAIVSPTQGSLIFNTDNSEVYERNATAWRRISSDGSETKIVGGNCMDVTGMGTTLNPYAINFIIPGKTQATAGTTCKQLIDTGCATVDGMYWIDPNGGSTSDAFQVHCNMTSDGGGWTLVFRHDVSGGFFANDAESDSFNESSPGLTTKKYSILNKIDSIKSATPYEFRLYYPNENIRNHWTQTFDPRSGPSSIRPVAGYTAIAIDSTGSYWGGLERSTSSRTFLDGSVNHGNWWYAIGTHNQYGSGMPGPSVVVDIVELYIR